MTGSSLTTDTAAPAGIRPSVAINSTSLNAPSCQSPEAVKLREEVLRSEVRVSAASKRCAGANHVSYLRLRLTTLAGWLERVEQSRKELQLLREENERE